MSASRKKSRGSVTRRGRRTTSGRIHVELATAQGSVFSGRVSAVEFAPASGVVQMEPDTMIYFGLVQAAEVNVRIGKRVRYFVALNASLALEHRRLTVLAEAIQPTVCPARNCANLHCMCGD